MVIYLFFQGPWKQHRNRKRNVRFLMAGLTVSLSTTLPPAHTHSPSSAESAKVCVRECMYVGATIAQWSVWAVWVCTEWQCSSLIHRPLSEDEGLERISDVQPKLLHAKPHAVWRGTVDFWKMLWIFGNILFYSVLVTHYFVNTT